MATTNLAVEWDAVHEAMRALDRARCSCEGLRIGYDGISDAIGGTYFGGHYEARGLAGLADLGRALRTITQHAWTLVHGASDRVRAQVDQGYAADWIVEYRHGSLWIPVTTRHYGIVRRFGSHRGAAIVAGRIKMGGRVRPGEALLCERRDRVYEEARAAVRTMLAARRVWDLLVAAGVEEAIEYTIPQGTSGGRVLLTGLLWLAGAAREQAPATIEQAIRFADGATPQEAFGEEAQG